MAIFKAVAKTEEDGSVTIACSGDLLMIFSSTEAASDVIEQLDEETKTGLSVIDVLVGKPE